MNGGFVPCSPQAVRCNSRSLNVSAFTTGRSHRHALARVRRARVPVMSAVPVEVSEENFPAEVLEADLPVLVDFYAGWCGPCKLVAPLMDWAATEYEGKLKVVKVDTEVNESFVKEYGIHGLPTFAVFKNGQAFGVQEGALGKDGLRSYIEKYGLGDDEYIEKNGLGDDEYIEKYGLKDDEYVEKYGQGEDFVSSE